MLPFLSIAFALLPAPSASPARPCTLPVQERRSNLNEEWIAKDFARIEQLIAALAEKELTVDGLKEHLGSCDVREDRAIGFGARRLTIAAYGGYTTAWVHVLAETPDDAGKSRVGELRCDQTGSPDRWNDVGTRLRFRWGPRIRDIESGFRAELRNEAVSRALRSACERELGVAGKVVVPEEWRPAFEKLGSPFEDLVLGKQYGDDGAPPPGRREIQALVESGRFDLVRAVLRGMNPEGRAWAAWALLERAKKGVELDPLDAAAIEKLRKLPLLLVTSHGCDVEHLRFAAALVYGVR